MAISRLLIANRGEVAVRVIRTAATLMSAEALGALAGPVVIATVVQFANPRYGTAAIALILGLLVAVVATAPAHAPSAALGSE